MYMVVIEVLTVVVLEILFKAVVVEVIAIKVVVCSEVIQVGNGRIG